MAKNDASRTTNEQNKEMSENTVSGVLVNCWIASVVALISMSVIRVVFIPPETPYEPRPCEPRAVLEFSINVSTGHINVIKTYDTHPCQHSRTADHFVYRFPIGRLVIEPTNELCFVNDSFRMGISPNRFINVCQFRLIKRGDVEGKWDEGVKWDPCKQPYINIDSIEIYDYTYSVMAAHQKCTEYNTKNNMVGDWIVFTFQRESDGIPVLK
jgi:hypothetical protein